MAGLPGRRLGEPGEGHLRVGVDAPRHGCGVDRRRVLAQQVTHDEHALGEADVGQLGRGDHVADGVDAGLAGP